MKHIITAVIIGFAVLGCTAEEKSNPVYSVNPSNDIVKLSHFELGDVRLLDSPFKAAMERDGKYLQSLDPDRLLAPYLKEADLEPKGENYGGWENTGLDGHSLGHYLSSVSMLYASTGDEEFKEIADYIVSELARAQDVIGTGYISGIPDGKETFAELASGDIRAEPFSLNDSWVPWYNIHKLYAGLRDAYLHADLDESKEVLIGLSDWAVTFSGQLSDEQFDTMLITEYGGMNEVLADVYAITADEKYLYVAQRFNDPRVFPPLTQGRDNLAGLHANTQIPKIIGAAREYELTGNDSLRQIATFFWDTVVENRTFANGGNSENEHFGELGTLDKRLTKVTSETCNTYNMLKLTERLMSWDPENPNYAEYYENALYNHILASQDPNTGQFCYFVPLESGHFKTFSDPENSFWCCVGSGMENHTKYGKNIYLYNENEVYVNLFIPSELTWEDKGLTLIQHTQFPNSEESSLVIEVNNPTEFTLNIRRPLWVQEGFSAVVNGDTVSASGSDTYMSLDRIWESGDEVKILLPMTLRLDPLEDRQDLAAVKYGPVLLAGKLGTEGMDIEPIPYGGFEDFDGRWDHRRYEDMPTVSAPVLQIGDRAISEWLKPTGEAPLVFRTNGAGNPADVDMEPFYQVNHQRYAIYWDLNTGTGNTD